MNIKLNKGLSL